jgi:hypothetical protein
MRLASHGELIMMFGGFADGTMRLGFSGPSVESLTGKRQFFPGERPQKLQTHRSHGQ